MTNQVITSESKRKPFVGYDKQAYIEEQKKRVDGAIDLILEHLKSPGMPELVKKIYIEKTGKPCDTWSLGNTIIRLFIGETTDARRLEGWNKVGRRVIKGSKAFYILEPVGIPVYQKVCPGCKKPLSKKGLDYFCMNGNCTKKGKCEKPDTNKFEKMGFKASARFRIEDTEIVDAAKWEQANKPYEPKQLPPLLDVAKDFGVTVEFKNSERGELGYATIDGKKIVLSCEDPDVYLHELTHIVHGKLEQLKPVQDMEQEAIAELTACALSLIYGYNAIPYSVRYLVSYSENQTKEAAGKLAWRVLSKVKTIIDIILADNQETRANMINEYKGKHKQQPQPQTATVAAGDQ